MGSSESTSLQENSSKQHIGSRSRGRGGSVFVSESVGSTSVQPGQHEVAEPEWWEESHFSQEPEWEKV